MICSCRTRTPKRWKSSDSQLSEDDNRPAEVSDVEQSRPAPFENDSATTDKVIAALDALLSRNAPELGSVPEATRVKVIGRLVGLVVGQLGTTADNHADRPEPSTAEPITPETFVPTPSTTKLLLDFEVGGGQPYYDRFLKVPTFPGVSSGVTIGIGYDLGFHTAEEITADWSESLRAAELKRLIRCSGINADRVGPAQVRSIAASLKNIAIPREAALNVFNVRTIPHTARQTFEAFPGLDRLHLEIIGALLSLVFNRGTLMTGDRRKEMREIREAIGRGAIDEIPRLIRAMKRYWGTRETPSNLLGRREREAQLVESGLRGGSLELHLIEEEFPDLDDFPGPILLGDLGANVRLLQRALASLGHAVAADGEFGPETLSAVKAFQRRAGITVDGEVGPVTWAVLRGKEAPTCLEILGKAK